MALALCRVHTRTCLPGRYSVPVVGPLRHVILTLRFDFYLLGKAFSMSMLSPCVNDSLHESHAVPGGGNDSDGVVPCNVVQPLLLLPQALAIVVAGVNLKPD